jgi:hypothetical protein
MTIRHSLPASGLLGSLHRGTISLLGATPLGVPSISGCGIALRRHFFLRCGCWQFSHFSSLGSPSQPRGFRGILHQTQCSAADECATAGTSIGMPSRGKHNHRDTNSTTSGKSEDSAASKDAISDKYSASAAGSNVASGDATFEPAADAEYLSLIASEASSTS